MSVQFKRLSKVLARSFSLDEESLQSCFRVADVGEISKITALRRDVFGNEIKDNDEIYLKWRYFSEDGQVSNLWVFDYENRIIAALGTEPVKLYHEGAITEALRNMDAIVDPEYNSRGLGAWMTLAMQTANDCVLVTGGNENSASMLDKLFTRLSVRKIYKIILHSRNFLSIKIDSAILVNLLTPLVDLLLAAFLNYKFLRIRQPENWRIEHYDKIEPLLAHIKNRTGVLGRVKVLRSESHLKWRYSINPVSKFNVVTLFEDQNCLGYVIYHCPETAAANETVEAFFMDWEVFEQSTRSQVLSLLFKAAIKALKQRGVDEINVELNDKDTVFSAEETGFILRHEDPNFFVFHKSLAADSPFYSADAWYHSLGDSDNI